MLITAKLCFVMKKQHMLILGVVILLIAAVAGVFALKNNKSADTTDETTKKQKIEEPVNVISLEERPYVQISPVADGRNIQLIIKELKKPANEAEYELEYQAGTLLQGIFGAIQLDKLPAQVTELLGSCSAGGKCSYHEDVKGGTLLLRFSGPENYALKQDWKYFDNSTKESAFSSKDAKFQLESESLSGQRYLVIYNSPGYPEGLEGTAVSEPYSLAVSSTLSGTGSLTMRANEEGSLKIMGWDGTQWHEFAGEMDGKMVTAEVDLMELYIVVKE